MPGTSTQGSGLWAGTVGAGGRDPVHVRRCCSGGARALGRQPPHPSPSTLGLHKAEEPVMDRGRKFYYITLLRDPVSRYLSEWRHVQRGATWKTSLHMCDGRTPTPAELPACYEGADWAGCTLRQFMECPYNLANNRQVRMLADLSLVGCYNMSFVPEKRRAQLLLESAKKNLRDMAFFGLTEFQRKTQYLFERSFRLRFIRPFVQYNSTRAAGVDLDNGTVRRIEELNELDMQLYDYARDLFQQAIRLQEAAGEAGAEAEGRGRGAAVDRRRGRAGPGGAGGGGRFAPAHRGLHESHHQPLVASRHGRRGGGRRTEAKSSKGGHTDRDVTRLSPDTHPPSSSAHS
ncbi:heparan-sulfate 6-O-sulfotransferase 1-A-like [Brachyhypopomus gauderio]|uniref:heparan-sulfate 6-O-sulfotransferase 1-A-like n=1 Tax=Brachyhypopomus gauderio TaxID=698409 RepID=UPI0040411776